MFTIEFTEGAVEDLKTLPARDRTRVLARIDDQLAHTPAQQTRNRGQLSGSNRPGTTRSRSGNCRVGTWRVFYDVAVTERRVVVRAVRRKPPHRTTEEIL